jgi:TRAP-type C4-dicarboxylate transport system permease small subunit
MKVSFFEKAVTGFSSWFNMVASAALVAMMLLTSVDVFMRYLFNHPITGTYDLVGLLGAVLAAFAMPYTMLKKGHVAVEILVQSLSRGKQLIVKPSPISSAFRSFSCWSGRLFFSPGI